MNGLAKCTVDELMRLLVPHHIRQIMGWNTNTALIMATNRANRAITLNATENCTSGVTCHMDDHFRITLPKEIRESVNINPKDTLTLEANVASGVLTVSA